MKLVIPVLVLTSLGVWLASKPRAIKPTEPISNEAIVLSETKATLAMPVDSPSVPRNIAMLLASLPVQFEDLRDLSSLAPTLAELEAALITNAESILPALLDRYTREPDAAYKGLLAVLLSADPSTHRRIVDDLRLDRAGEWELFQGAALFALARETVDIPSDALSKESLDQWKTLVGFLDTEDSNQRRKREEAALPRFKESAGIIIYCSRAGHRDPPWEVMARLDQVRDPAFREVFLQAWDREWSWNWGQLACENAIQNAAKEDMAFAKELIERYVLSGDSRQARKGFRLVDGAKVPLECIPLLRTVAQGFLNDNQLFSDAVELLGYQQQPESESTLLELYAVARGREDCKERLLTYMNLHKGDSFVAVARAELGSASPLVRIRAMNLLATVDPERSIEPVNQALGTDPDPAVRVGALAVLTGLDRWTPREEEALARVALEDPHVRVRELAARILASTRRKGLYWLINFSIDPERDYSADPELE